MTYFLDFDRTIFDTDAFVGHLFERPDVAALRELPEEELASILNERCASGEMTFAPEELKPFVYADAREVLRALGNEAIILTFGNPALQKLKITNALEGIPRVSVIYTDDVRKGTYMKERMGAYRDPVLVDDRVIELENMQAECPQVRLYEMRRDEKEGDGRWPVIRSLNELP